MSVLPFVQRDKRKTIDEELLDQQRAEEIARLAATTLENLEIERQVKGEVDHLPRR